MFSISNWMATRRKDRALDREIAQLDDRDLNGLQVSRGELRELAHMSEDRVASFHKMATRYGVPEQDAHAPGVASGPALACARCGAAGQCKGLADSAGTDVTDRFCPNAEAFKKLAAA